jgi:5-formyltetrahydrofolate cyclo-ligase
MTDKQALRARLRALPTPPPASSQAICQALRTLPELERAETVLAFYPMTSEPDIRPVLEALLAAGKRLCLPRCLPGNQLAACAVTDLGQLVPDQWGIPSPPETAPVVPSPDLVLVPGMAFDRACRRLGHGAGYYDRFLQTFSGVTVGVCFAQQLLDEVPVRSHDRPVDLVLTDAGLVRNEVYHGATQ